MKPLLFLLVLSATFVFGYLIMKRLDRFLEEEPFDGS